MITKHEFEILDHTLHRAAHGCFCGHESEMRPLVDAGLMEFAFRKSYVPEPYWRCTAAGREAFAEARPVYRPDPPPVSARKRRSRERYRRWMAMDSGQPFGEFLKENYSS